MTSLLNTAGAFPSPHRMKRAFTHIQPHGCRLKPVLYAGRISVYLLKVLRVSVASTIFLALCCVSLFAQQARATTICDLQARAYDGGRISLNTRMLFTMHGSYLLGDKCPGRAQHSAALLFPGVEGAPQVPFELDPTAISKLRPFYRTTGGSAIACAVLSGEVIYKKGFRLRHIGGVAVGNGYGEDGRLQRAFILEAVQMIHGCE